MVGVVSEKSAVCTVSAAIAVGRSGADGAKAETAGGRLAVSNSVLLSRVNLHFKKFTTAAIARCNLRIFDAAIVNLHFS